MKNVRTIGVYLLTVVAMAVFMAGGQVNAQEANEPKENQKAYEYVTQPGDSYTQMVRKAVQTYGINNKKDIGQARIIAIETKLTEEVGWPVLMVGQKVKINEETVSKAVDNAMNLSEQDVAAWQTYVPYIDFTTDHVGEAKE